MDNNQIRPQLSPKDQAAMLAHLQQVNPQMFARLQAMNPEIMETGGEHLFAAAAAAAAANAGKHGHSHNHSSSCGHAHTPAHFSQPVPEPPPKPSPAEMSIVQAIQYNELDRAKEIIESGQTDVNTPDEEGCYLLHWAAINNHVEIIRYLISKGASVDIKGGDLQSTPLHWACRQGCIEAFFILVDNGASLHSTDVNLVQPIHLAAQYGQIKILSYLLGSGIDVDCYDGRSFTPLIYSCLGPPQNYTPIANATHVCCTQFLLTFGANINYQEPTRQYTPIHFAINNRNPISFHVLLKSPQINLNLKNNDNFDVLTFARIRQNLEAVETLEDRLQSAKANVKPKFIQRFVTNEFVRKWLTRFYMFLCMTLIGLSANSTEYSYLIRILFPIILIFMFAHIFNYFVFDDHTKDNLAFAYVLSSTLLMYGTYMAYLQENRWTLKHICYHFVTLYGLYSFHCINKYTPGFLKQQSMNIDGNSLTREKICTTFARDPRWTLDHFCVTCLIRRPLRSKHCPVDGTCVSKFDHHCTWLDACIGGRNYFYFIRLLTCATMGLIFWMSEAISHISGYHQNNTFGEIFTMIFDPWFNYILLLNSFNSIWVTLMTSFHLYNSIYLGVTLNERLTGFRYSYFRDENTGKFVNPFRNQLLKNFLETFGFFQLMPLFRYTRTDWSQIYDINQITGRKLN
ncbi:unnamed protein product [Adineta steineri]|uniref:Palmitoyltransferase n=1 Tax=Adineta steineri TaxID=433720 RepID=A0A816DRE3_9BILA|nr:unnamed protein product [Adineta steineri]CAF1637311.1 unnamed protein product [Adineta steineri]